jgi:uncharacterized membrane protein YqjE
MAENVQGTSRLTSPTGEPPSVASLVGGIISDAERLVQQELKLAKKEIQQEWDKAKVAGGALLIGLGVMLVAAILLTQMVVELLNQYAFPGNHWVSYLIVGAILAAVGGVLFYMGKKQADEISLVPPETAESLKENVQWLQNPR